MEYIEKHGKFKRIIMKFDKFLIYKTFDEEEKTEKIYIFFKNEINKFIRIYWKNEFKNWLLIQKDNFFYLKFKNKYYPLTFSYEKRKFYIYAPFSFDKKGKILKRRIFKFPLKYKAYNVLKLRKILEIYWNINILKKI